MTPRKRRPTKRTIYLKPDDAELWRRVEDYAKSTHHSVSSIIAETLRRFFAPKEEGNG